MQTTGDSSTGKANGAAACWRSIGVQGDRSCPQLAEVVHCRNCPTYASAGQQLFDREAPADYVDEWTRRLAQVEAAVSADVHSLLIFRVGAEWLALDVGWLVEVVEPRRIHRVPHRTDRLLLGLVNIRGELQLCVSLRDLLGVDPAPPAEDEKKPHAAAVSSERLLVVDDQQNRWVLPVQEVAGVHGVAASALEELPDTVEKSPRFLCEAVLARGDKKIGVLDRSRLFEALGRIAR
jgi:chemotaxis-related protein WspD